MSIPVIPLDRLIPSPSNIRTDLGDLDELAASIRAVGLLQPLVVQPDGRGGFVVVDGHRRLAAARLVGAKALPCLAVKATAGGRGDRGAAQIEVMLAAAMHKQLEPLEQAHAFKALRNRGMSVTEIARRTGYTSTTVSGRLLLVDLPTEAQAMVRDGELTVTQATDLARQVRRTSTASTTVRAPKASWFTPGHRLAATVRRSCGHTQTRARVGGAGCGQCWEDAIRMDERERQDRRAGA